MAPLTEELPVWPPGDPGRVLLHLDIKGGSVDAVFADLFGNNSEFQGKLHAVRGDSNCVESPWFDSRNELPAQQYVWEGAAPGTDLGTPAPGKFRKVRFEAPPPPLASRGFQNEEVQKVLEASPGSHYLVETEVLTNAMYGDKFTIMCRYTLVARGPSACELHLVYVINFVPSMTRMMKPVVTKGVEGGIRGTFNHVRRILGAQYNVEDYKDGHPAPTTAAAYGTAAVAATTQPAPTPLQPAAGGVRMPPAQPAALFGLADYLVYQDLVAKVVALPDTVLIAKALAIALTLAMLHAAITLLRPLQSACASAGGWLGALCWPLVNVLDFPDTLVELLSGLLLVAVVNRLLALGTEVASDYLRESARQAQRTHAMQQAAAAAAQEAAGSGATDAAPQTAPIAAGPSMARLEIASADDGRKASPPTGMGAFLSKSFTTSKPKAAPAAAAPAAVSSTSSPAATKVSVAAPDSAPSSAPGSRGPSPAPQAAATTASPTPSPIQTSSPVMGALAREEGDKAQQGNVVGKMWNNGAMTSWSAMNSWSKSLLAANNEVVDSMSSSSENFKSFMTGAWQRTQESAKNLILAEAGGSGPLMDTGNTASSPRSRARSNSDGGGAPAGIGARHGHTPSFTTTIDAGGFSIIEDYAQAEASALPELAEESSLVGVEGAASAAASAAPTPRPQRAVTPVEDAAMGVAPAPSVGAPESEAYSETGVDEVEEEVFEHERVQPFRGWGHTWPGHFLPSDRVGHWGDRKGLPGGTQAASFELVAPRTRDGWEWRDPEWRIDCSGQDQEAVDNDGWAYGMDFGWMTWPPAPGSGKATLKAFVRRRRWVRVRVRSPEGGGGGMQLRPMSRASQERMERGEAADKVQALEAGQVRQQQQQQGEDAQVQDQEGLDAAKLGEGDVLEDDEPLLPLEDDAPALTSLPVTGIDAVDMGQQEQQAGNTAGQSDKQPTEFALEAQAPAISSTAQPAIRSSVQPFEGPPTAALAGAAVDAAAKAPLPSSPHNAKLMPAELDPLSPRPSSPRAASSPRVDRSPRAVPTTTIVSTEATGQASAPAAPVRTLAPVQPASGATAPQALPASASATVGASHVSSATVAKAVGAAGSSSHGAGQPRAQRPMRLRSGSQAGAGSSSGGSSAGDAAARNTLSPTTSIGSALGKSPHSPTGGAPGSPLASHVSPKQPSHVPGPLLQQTSFGATSRTSRGGGVASRPLARTTSNAASAVAKQSATGASQPQGESHLDEWSEW